MKKKYLIAALAIGLSLSAKVMAQVPNYVPTNGLVGWWPFNGNPNDQSGNGWLSTINNTANGSANLCPDRFNSSNNAYSFTGTGFNGNSIIQTNYIGIMGQNPRTVNLWFKLDSGSEGEMFHYGGTNGGAINLYLAVNRNMTIDNSNSQVIYDPSVSAGVWHMLTFVYSNTYGTNTLSCKIFLDTVLLTQIVSQYNANQTLYTTTGNPIGFGGFSIPFNGDLDDIGMWNRVLSSQEIAVLYNGCSASPITSQPVNSVINVGSNAQFTVNAAAESTYQWQSNPANFGWQNVPNNSSYSGGTTNTLTVNNTTVSNHHQPFRAIVNAGGCIDTSDVAQIIIGDTCLTTVTDTLIINTTLGLPAPNNENTILIYPNPASDHITIDNGNYTAMTGYSLKITNNAGQQVFQSAINQAQFYVDLSTWSGDGLYFVHLIDPQNNTVTVRKIVLQ